MSTNWWMDKENLVNHALWAELCPPQNSYLDPVWCGSVDWVPACEPKCHWFNSQSGHMHGLQSRSPVWGLLEAIDQCISCTLMFLSLSPFLPFSEKKKMLYIWNHMVHNLWDWLFPPLLTTRNKAAFSIHVQVSYEHTSWFLWDKYPGVHLLSCVVVTWVSLKNCHTVFQNDYPSPTLPPTCEHLVVVLYLF